MAAEQTPDEKKPKPGKKPEDMTDEEKKAAADKAKADEVAKAGKLEAGLTSVKERIDSLMGKVKAGTVDASVTSGLRALASDLGKLADAYPSPKSEKRDFDSGTDAFDQFVADEVKGITAEADQEVAKARGEMLGTSIEEFRKAVASIEGTERPVIPVTVWVDPNRQPAPTSTTLPETGVDQGAPTIANIGKGDGEAAGAAAAGDAAGAAAAGDAAGEGDGDELAGAAAGEGVQDGDDTGDGEGKDKPTPVVDEDGVEWGDGWDDLTKVKTQKVDDEPKPPPSPRGAFEDMTVEADDAPARDGE